MSNRRACECDREYYLIMSDEGLASESLVCETCPKGARCANDDCALRNNAFNCSDGSTIMGNWSKDDTGHYELTSCPSGYELKTSVEQGSADLQQCFKCPTRSYYILRPDVDSCQPCPAGLNCHGDETLDPITTDSMWVQNGSIFKLESCPYGHSAISINHEGVKASEQQCTPCEKGMECKNPPCTACSECISGFYKSAVSNEACLACPENTYGQDNVDRTQLGYCKACPTGSDTKSKTGQTGVMACQCSIGTYQTGDSCIR